MSDQTTQAAGMTPCPECLDYHPNITAAGQPCPNPARPAEVPAELPDHEADGCDCAGLTPAPEAPASRWCRTCGNPVEGTPGHPRCACWCMLADALQRYLGMDFDGAAQMAADLWDSDGDHAYVWANRHADTHDVPVYPDTRAYAPEAVREADKLAFPHDEDCPRCGRRQWGLAAADPMNPTDDEQETCGACRYVLQDEDTR